MTTQFNTSYIHDVPKIIFHDHVSPGVDIWVLAVLMHMVLSGESLLFDSYNRIKKIFTLSHVFCTSLCRLSQTSYGV